jgi:hypothetical protein
MKHGLYKNICPENLLWSFLMKIKLHRHFVGAGSIASRYGNIE